MSRRLDALDGQPGPIPDIRTDVRGLTFVIHPLGTRSDERLLIRCDDAGDVWMSIRSDVRSDD
jgi:hypothetical protein